jgi:hypothetical protein
MARKRSFLRRYEWMCGAIRRADRATAYSSSSHNAAWALRRAVYTSKQGCIIPPPPHTCAPCFLQLDNIFGNVELQTGCRAVGLTCKSVIISMPMRCQSWHLDSESPAFFSTSCSMVFNAMRFVWLSIAAWNPRLAISGIPPSLDQVNPRSWPRSSHNRRGHSQCTCCWTA